MSPLTSLLFLVLVASSSAAIVLSKQVHVKIDLNVKTIFLDIIDSAQCSAVNTVTQVIAVPASLIPAVGKFVWNAAYTAQLIVIMSPFAKREEITSMVLRGFNVSIGGGALSALSNLQSLDVAYNNMNSLSLNSLPSTLIKLDISGNIIPRNDIGSALNLHNLTSLSMSNCGLSNLTGVLVGVSNLEFLDVRDNNIINLVSKYLPSALRTLMLCGNPLSLPEAGSILNLPQLTSLSMSNCDIRELPEGALGGLPNLKILDISKNQISTFPAKLISDVPLLDFINLDYNRIQKFTNMTISQLHHLSVAYNLIKLSSEPILNAPYLLSLNLDNNPIESITAITLSGLVGLEVVSMANHRIKNVLSSYFSYLSHLTELNLESPTICLGNLTDLRNWAKSSNVSLNVNCTSWTCGRVPVSQPQCMYI